VNLYTARQARPSRPRSTFSLPATRASTLHTAFGAAHAAERFYKTSRAHNEPRLFAFQQEAFNMSALTQR